MIIGAPNRILQLARDLIDAKHYYQQIPDHRAAYRNMLNAKSELLKSVAVDENKGMYLRSDGTVTFDQDVAANDWILEAMK